MADKKSETPHAHKDEESKSEELVIKDATLGEARTDQDSSGEKAPQHPEQEDVKETPDSEQEQTTSDKPKKPKETKGKFWTRKKAIIIAAVAGAVVVALGVLMLVPLTRYAILGTFIKRDITITLHDSKTNKPVSEAAVSIGGSSGLTNSKGVVTLKSIALGNQKITIHKKYFQDTTTTRTVELGGNNPSFDVSIVATGRQVPVKVINKISQQPVENAQITADGTSSKTDKDGAATLVLPADKASMNATVTTDGYNNLAAQVIITEQQDDKNTFSIVPSGKVYFLSKRTGKIDVMKSNLDGSDAQTVLAGTGNENDYNTVLFASNDWKYVALIASRDSDKVKSYLIDATKGDKLSTIDEGDADFNAQGWSGSTLVYTVFRHQGNAWDAGRVAIKSYNAQTSKLTVLDQTDGATVGYTHASEVYNSNIYVLDNTVLFGKTWTTYYAYNGYNDIADRSGTIASVQLDGQNKKVLQTTPVDWGMNSHWFKPQEVYFETSKYTFPNTTQYAHYDYANGSLKSMDITNGEYNKSVSATFLLSPSRNRSFWYDIRDGKYTLFVGDKDGNNAQQIATNSDFRPYGWLGEDYLLVSKDNNELYIMSRNNPAAPAVKVSDYHKPQYSMGGGGGYGIY